MKSISIFLAVLGPLALGGGSLLASPGPSALPPPAAASAKAPVANTTTSTTSSSTGIHIDLSDVTAALADAKAKIAAAGGPNLERNVQAHLSDALRIVEQTLQGLGKDIDKAAANFDADAFAKRFENFGKQFEQWGEAVARDFGDDVNIDIDLSGGPPSGPTSIAVPDVAFDLADLALSPIQRGQIVDAVTRSQAAVAPATARLAQTGIALEQALAQATPDSAAIDRLIDAMAADEAIVRKAQLAAWTAARAQLSLDQRTQIEAAVGHP